LHAYNSGGSWPRGRIAGLLLVLLAGTASALGGDPLVPGTFHVDEPTLRSLALRWIVDGDDDQDAVARLEFRRVGATTWRRGPDLLRIHGEPAGTRGWVCGNLFAGSVLRLEPGTSYELRVTLEDPDGVEGDPVRTATATTRTWPQTGDAAPSLHVDVTCGADVPSPCYTDLRDAAAAAEPGDVVLIHDGLYLESTPIDLGSVLRSKSTSAAQPIVFRGESRDGVVFDRQLPDDSRDNEMFLRLGGTRHVHLEDFTIANAGLAIGASDAEGLVVRRLRLDKVWSGLTGSSDARARDLDWIVSDNEILGRNDTWYPYSDQSNSISHTGIMIYGRGHSIENNRVRGFWDCIAHADVGVDNTIVDWTDPPSRSIDISNNELEECYDDGIEGDYGFHNVRILDNRVTNAHTALSAQPFYGGPLYLVGNVADNVVGNSLKLHNQPAGVVAYHNTLLVHDIPWDSTAGFVNVRIANNLMLAEAWSSLTPWVTGTPPHARSVIDHNGHTGPTSGRLVKWNRAAYLGSDWHSYDSFAAFHAGEGFQEHGLLVDYSIFESAAHPPGEGTTLPSGANDLRLRSAALARDAGMPIVGINEGFEGAAPDLGAYEHGAALPFYGPRPRCGTPVEVGPTLTVAHAAVAGEIEFHWEDVAGASRYTVTCDTDPLGSFDEEEGSSPSGVEGLVVPMRPGAIVHYLVHGDEGPCSP
jgi:hypothetical protein